MSELQELAPGESEHMQNQNRKVIQIPKEQLLDGRVSKRTPKYRIIQDKFGVIKVQYRVLWFFWVTVQKEVWGWGDYDYEDITFDSVDDARRFIIDDIEANYEDKKPKMKVIETYQKESIDLYNKIVENDEGVTRKDLEKWGVLKPEGDGELTSLSEMKDKLIGESGTPEREKYESELAEEIRQESPYGKWYVSRNHEKHHAFRLGEHTGYGWDCHGRFHKTSWWNFDQSDIVTDKEVISSLTSLAVVWLNRSNYKLYFKGIDWKLVDEKDVYFEIKNPDYQHKGIVVASATDKPSTTAGNTPPPLRGNTFPAMGMVVTTHSGLVVEIESIKQF